MAGTRLFYKLQFCDATDCTTNHFPKVLAIENNIVFHFDVMLIENRLKPYFLPHITEFNRITHLQYMDTVTDPRFLGSLPFSPYETCNKDASVQLQKGSSRTRLLDIVGGYWGKTWRI